METDCKVIHINHIKLAQNYCLQFILLVSIRNTDEYITVRPEKSIKMIDIFSTTVMKALGTIMGSVCTVTVLLVLYFRLH